MFFALLFSLISVVSCHLCLVNPLQFNGIASSALNTKGAAACDQQTGPCGNGVASSIRMVGNNTLLPIVFQKNLDHFFSRSSSFFAIDIAWANNPTEGQFINLKKVPDLGDPSLSFYSTEVLIDWPQTSLAATLRVRYVTGNKNAPPVFYQCASLLQNI